MQHHRAQISLQMMRLSLASLFLLGLMGFKTTKTRAITWSEVVTYSRTWHTRTTQAQLIKILGEPYKQAPTTSLPDEYIMYFHAPKQPGRMYWIMLDTQTRRYLYWSEGTQKKPK